MGFADLHIHTIYSWDGTSTVSGVLKKAAHHLGLDVIAITDHNTVAGSLKAQEMAPEYQLEVITGSEISTAEGHLLALFIREDIPKKLSLVDTLLRIKEQGGIAIAAHPAAHGVKGLKPDAIRRALDHPEAGEVLVGVETFNAGLVYMQSNQVAKALAQELSLSAIGASDAHLLWMIGRGKTEFPGRTAADLRQALEERTTRAIASKPTFKPLLLLRWFSRYLLREIGWVNWNPHPQAPLRLGHISRAGSR